MDKETKDLLYKALGSAQVSGTIIQEVIDKVIAHLFFSENPLRANLSVKQGTGTAYVFNRRSPTASGGQSIPDTGSFTAAEGTYTRISLPYKIYGTAVEVTKFAQAAGLNFIDVLQTELEARINEFKEWEQRALLWGNYVAPFSGANTHFADGFVKQIVDNKNGNIVALGTTSAGDNLTLSALDRAIDMCWGNPSIIICSRTGRRILQGLLQAQQRFVNTVEIKGGFRVMEYAGLPVLPSTAIPDTCVYVPNPTDDKYISALTGGSTTVMIIMNLTDAFIAELERLTAKEVPVSSSQYIRYEIYEYITPVVKTPKMHSIIFGIKTT